MLFYSRQAPAGAPAHGGEILAVGDGAWLALGAFGQQRAQCPTFEVFTWLGQRDVPHAHGVRPGTLQGLYKVIIDD